MEVDVKPEIPTPPASDVGSPQSSGPFSHHGSDSEPDSPMEEDSKVAETQIFQSSCHAFNEIGISREVIVCVSVWWIIRLLEVKNLEE